MAGRKKSAYADARRCEYQQGAQRCQTVVAAGVHYCSRHSQPLADPKELAEAVALTPEGQAAVRQELGLPDAVRRETVAMRGESRSAMAKEVPEVVDEDAGQYLRKRWKGKAAQPEENPVAAATRLALKMVADQQKARGAGAMQMSATEHARLSTRPYFPALPDMSAMVDEEGRSLVKKGWVPRWVRVRDMDGRPTSRRLRQFYLLGAEDVMKDGKPLEDTLGKAIQIPPEAYAAWLLHTSHSATYDSAAVVQEMQGAADGINEEMGRLLVRVEAGDTHKLSRDSSPSFDEE